MSASGQCGHSRRSQRALLQLTVLFSFTVWARAANPVKTPIIRNAAYVYTRQFAQLPTEQGRPAKTVCLVPQGRSLYACTLHSVFRITRTGHVTKFLNVDRAIRRGTRGARGLDTTQRVHGGVRSIAFPSDFRRTGLFYLSAMETRPRRPRKHWYVSDVDNPIAADSVVLELRYDRAHARVDPRYYRCVLRVGIPKYDHTIRQITFRGRMLFVAHGDGSEQAATVGGGQNGDARGKILRIDPRAPDGRRRGDGRRPYRVPDGNPFRGAGDMADEVWALGFRNPHNMCFGRDGTLYVADTGRSNVEEVNVVRRGRNYGWSSREGTFVHKGGRLIHGIRPLPRDDAKYGFDYPAAQVGHDGPPGAGFIGQAIAGACPVENGSPMAGAFWYADFPLSGRLFFSKLGALKHARTRGDPRELTQARTREAVVCLERWIGRGGARRKIVQRVETLGGAVRAEKRYRRAERADVRFGRGSRGEIYWSSKTNGKVYIFTSSLRDGPRGKC